MPRVDRRRFLALGASPLLLAGCSVPGFTSNSGGGASTVNVWYWNRSMEDSLFPAFEAENPGVTANATKIGGDYASRLNTTLAGRAFVPDVAAMNSDIARYFPAEDQFVDLYDLGAGDLESSYLPWKWQLGVTNDGKMIGFPMDTGPTALYYRADLFEQAGLPSEPDDVTAALDTWEAYIEAGTELQTALPEVSFLDNVLNVYNQSLSQEEVFYVNADDLFVGDGDHIRRAWDRALQVRERQLAANVNAFTPDWSAGINNGTVASFVGASWMKQVLQESGDAGFGLWRVAQAPGGPGNNGGSFISVTAAAGDEDLAFRLITFLHSAESQAEMYRTLALFPSALDALASDAIQEPEDFFGGQATGLEFARSAEQLQPFYSDPSFPVANSIFTQAITDIAVGGVQPDGQWERAQDRARRELQHKHPWVRWED